MQEPTTRQRTGPAQAPLTVQIGRELPLSPPSLPHGEGIPRFHRLESVPSEPSSVYPVLWKLDFLSHQTIRSIALPPRPGSFSPAAPVLAAFSAGLTETPSGHHQGRP